MTDTATVETLTAEVRVLMVGNRQVTQSVFKQLDWVERGAMTAFGRVNVAKGEDSLDRIDLVGADEHGNLVRSSNFAPVWQEHAPSVFEHWANHQKVDYSNPCNVDEKFRGHQMRWKHLQRRKDFCTAPRCREDLHIDGRCRCHDWTNFSPEAVTVRWLAAEYLWRRNQGDFCDLAELDEAWRDKARDTWRQLVDDQTLYDEDRQRPLIVLAGLR